MLPHHRQIAAWIFAGMALFLVACGPPPDALYPKKLMPANATFTGTWYSNDWGGRILLNQSGDQVSGKFNEDKGEMVGEITGVLDGGVLLFDWVRRGNINAGERDIKGKGYVVIGDDNESLTGEWGLHQRRKGGSTNRKKNEGKWAAERISKLPENE